MTGKILAWLKVEERPEPPPGAGADLRIFRASRQHLRYLFLGWGLKQASALLGILISLAYFAGWDIPFANMDPFREWLDEADVQAGPFQIDLAVWIHRLEIFALATFGIQMTISGWWLHLSWRLHWYMVGDEMMRIREGLWQVREQTFTISKIQNMTVHQNILQKLFGIGDLEVHTAGGGGKSDDEDDEKGQLHVGWFRGMDDPWALRDELRAGLSRFAGSGLGAEDHDEAIAPAAPPASPEPFSAGASGGLVEAARELRDEARHLRHAFASSRTGDGSIGEG
ncbi:MAG: PH domain-containing protein [Acidobacteriota bacterium]